MGDRPVVSVRHWKQLGDVSEVLGACLADIGGLEQIVRPGSRIVIKPNITADAPEESGGTTHVALVAALIEEVKRCQAGGIIVAEGTGAFGVTHESAFPTGGWRAMAEEAGAALWNLDAGDHRSVPDPTGLYGDSMSLAELVLDADVYITVPCLKTHISCDYTVALKNSYALTPQPMRSEIHRRRLLEEAIVAINAIRAPDLAIVDGFDGSEGEAGGTCFEHPAGARVMLAGRDPVAVDTVARAAMGLDRPTRYHTWAAQLGLGEGHLTRIHVAGDDLDACSRRFMWPAEQIDGELERVSLCDLGACSGCRMPAVMGLRRFPGRALREQITVAFGGRGELPEGNVRCTVGDCAVAAGKGEVHVPGCPPTTADLVQALIDKGIVCQKCRDVARAAMADLPDALLERLRVTAAADEVHRGRYVVHGIRHKELMIGDCMASYAKMAAGRAPAVGLVAEEDIAFCPGCPPEVEDIRETLCRWAVDLTPAWADGRIEP
jgi:uncharacterized protein (DUF362 family)